MNRGVGIVASFVRDAAPIVSSLVVADGALRDVNRGRIAKIGFVIDSSARAVGIVAANRAAGDVNNPRIVRVRHIINARPSTTVCGLVLTDGAAQEC